MDEKHESPAVVPISGGWAFFSGLGNPRRGDAFYGAFFALEGPGGLSKNVYHNERDDDLPIAAVLIPY